MRKFVYIFLALATIFVSSCSKDKKTATNILGQWDLTDVTLTTKATQIGDQTVSVFLDFQSDGTYTMYQMLNKGRHRIYKGTWAIQDNLLKGTYQDGKKVRDWGNVYSVSVEGDVLTMTATVNSADVNVYTRCTIPEDVIKNAVRP